MGSRNDVFTRSKRRVKRTERFALINDTRRMAALAVIRINEDNWCRIGRHGLGFTALLLLPTVSGGHWHRDLNQCECHASAPTSPCLALKLEECVNTDVQGLEDILLINSKCSSKKATTLQTVKVPRSDVLDRVQSFLPQMAQANDELKRKMVTAPAHQFDIEHLDSETEKVIEMDICLMFYSSDRSAVVCVCSEDDSESDEDDSVTDEVTVDNIKFPKQKGEKGKIEILDRKENE
ncbi:uncharacterized protein C12orf45 homolog [Cyanistes caeruleus]|uniref:uncharacterized protein C12orf45 homolog n=1 Tax=Cyanistes caeruleus TaxID=156563 RepID=UPI000CDB0768|nr:uncharacterized protein C12orf45 homolog [Cyanistes caeruleus]